MSTQVAGQSIQLMELVWLFQLAGFATNNEIIAFDLSNLKEKPEIDKVWWLDKLHWKMANPQSVDDVPISHCGFYIKMRAIKGF